MKRAALILLAMLCLPGIQGCSPEPSEARRASTQMTDEEIRNLLRERTEGLRETPGIVLALLDENGERVFSYGKPRLDSDETFTADSLFKLASITKVFTSIILADMAERGEVNLDDPVAQYLPETVKMPARGGKQILLRHLATHTSGLPGNPDDMTGQSEYTVQQLYAFLARVQLTRDIGTEYEYSNIGMALLAHVLSRRAGTGYETLVRTRVLDPIGMSNSRNTLTAEMRAHLPLGYENGKPVINPIDPYAGFGGVGALYSTPNDLLKFLDANLGLRQTPVMPALRRSHQVLSKAYENVDVGLGWHITGPMVWHDGGGAGQRTFLAFHKLTGRGVAMFWNSMYDLSDIGIHLLDNGKPLLILPTPVALGENVLDTFAGRYQFEGSGSRGFTLRREGKQLVGRMGENHFEILAASQSELFFRDIDVTLTAFRDANGVVDRIVSRQNGVEESARRVRPVELDEDVLDSITGRYQFEGRGSPSFTIRREGKHLIAEMDNDRFPLLAVSENEFLFEDEDVSLTVLRDNGGNVDRIISRQNGIDVTARRVR